MITLLDVFVTAHMIWGFRVLIMLSWYHICIRKRWSIRVRANGSLLGDWFHLQAFAIIVYAIWQALK